MSSTINDFKREDEDLELLRRLDYCERSILVRDHAGRPPNICALASVRIKGGEEEIKEFYLMISNRIEKILQDAPHLSIFLEDDLACFPRFARFRNSKRFKVKDILTLKQIEWNEEDEKDKTIEEQYAKIQLRIGDWQMKNLNVNEHKPLWKVQFIQSSPKSEIITIVLAMNHIIGDGRAMHNILGFLITSPNVPLPDSITISGTMAVKDITAPTNEIVMPEMRISNLAMIWIKIRQKLFMLIPKFIRTFLFRSNIQWPTKMLPGANFPSIITSDVILLRGGKGFGIHSGSILQPIRNECIKNGIQSIHSALYTAALVATMAMIKPSETLSNQIIKTITPMSFRNESKCGLFAGNYVGIYSRSQRFPIHSSIKLWNLSKSYSKQLKSKIVWKEAQRIYNLLPIQYNDKILQNSYQQTKDHFQGPTNWEIDFNKQLIEIKNGKGNFNVFALSDTGSFSNVDKRVIGISWRQAIMVSNVLSLCVCRWNTAKDEHLNNQEDQGEVINDGLSISIGFQENILVTKLQEKVFRRALKRSLELLMNGKWSPDISFGEILHSIDS